MGRVSNLEQWEQGTSLFDLMRIRFFKTDESTIAARGSGR